MKKNIFGIITTFFTLFFCFISYSKALENKTTVEFYYLKKGEGLVLYTTRDCIENEINEELCELEVPPDLKIEKDYMLGWKSTVLCDCWVGGFQSSNFISLDNGPKAIIPKKASKLYACFAGINLNSPDYVDGKTPRYQINYDLNGGDSGQISTQYKSKGEENFYLSNVKPEKKGYEFVEWNTRNDGTGGSFAVGSEYVGNAPMTLYAQWKVKDDNNSDDDSSTPSNPSKPTDSTTPSKYYTLYYDCNGGSGKICNQSISIKNGEKTTAPEQPIRNGYYFDGWYIKSNNKKFDFGNNLDSDVYLYANWKVKISINEEKEIDKNAKTGDALIQFVWIIGICALGYSIYYFKNKKQEN